MPTLEAIRHRPKVFHQTYSPAYAGLEDGLIAGFVMMLFAMVCWAVVGQPAATPLRLIASTFLGPSAVVRDHLWLPVVVGMVVHFSLSVLFSILFAEIVAGATLPRASLLGVVFGLAIGLLMRFVVLPLVNPTMALINPVLFYLAHLAFGLALAFIPAFLRQPDREIVTNRDGSLYHRVV